MEEREITAEEYAAQSTEDGGEENVLHKTAHDEQEDVTADGSTDGATDGNTDEEDGDGKHTDYSEIEKADLCELKTEFPELASVKRIIDLSNPLRYAQLRDLGLSAKEAYLASSGTLRRASGKEHLKGSVVPRGAGVRENSMSLSELKCAREIFGNLSDDELQRLYAKVTK